MSSGSPSVGPDGSTDTTLEARPVNSLSIRALVLLQRTRPSTKKPPLPGAFVMRGDGIEPPTSCL
jgi:hypothetical protein